MNTRPFFSVIIPTYNRKTFVEKAVLSVLSQTWREFELIVVDDGSTDETERSIRRINDERIRFFRQEHLGVSSARNTGINNATGDFAAFLDSDDLWVSEKLERTAFHIDLFPDINIFHTEEIWFRRGELLRQKKKHAKPSGWVFENALPLCCIGMSTAVVKMEVFDRIGLFDETFEACEDYDLWLRAAGLYEVKLIPEALTVKHGGRKDQLSSKVWGLDRFRIKTLEKILRSGSLSGKNRCLALSELEKKCEIYAAGSEKRARQDDAEYYRKLSREFK